MAHPCLVIFALLARAATAASVNFRGSGQLKRADVAEVLKSELAASDSRHTRLEMELEHLYTNLPKNAHGHLGHQAVRSALHRHFLQKNGWNIRGLDPVVFSAISGAEPESLLEKDRVPQILEELFEGSASVRERGTSLRELAALALALEDLTSKEARAHLLDAWRLLDLPLEGNISRTEAEKALHTYYMSYLREHNWAVDNVQALAADEMKVRRSYRDYNKTFDLLNKWMAATFPSDVTAPVNFEQSMAVTAKIGQEYHVLIEEQCVDMRAALQGMESKRLGRVRLSTFYNKSLHSMYAFDERVETLRALGALDESDPTQLYVIISNYVLARPNCMNASNIYEVCCRNECEDIMKSLEQHVGASADAEAVARHVASLSSPSRAPRTLPTALLGRLREISAHHGGQVPLHGRLFAQWLHHAYPLECPFPVESGSVNPNAWSGGVGDSATVEEMQRTVEADTCNVDWQGKVDCGEELTELPWSMDERLLETGVASRPNKAAGAVRNLLLCVLFLALAAAIFRPSETGPARYRLAALLFVAVLALCGLLNPLMLVLGTAMVFGLGAASRRTAGETLPTAKRV